MKRLAADKEGFAKSQEGRLDPKLIGLKIEDIDLLNGKEWSTSIKKATGTLNTLIDRVVKLRDNDREIIANKIKSVESNIAVIPDANVTGSDFEKRTRFRLLRL